MNTSLSFVAVIVLTAACLGYGSLVLVVGGILKNLNGIFESIALSFVVGFGVLGWLVFFAGITGYLRYEVLWGTGLIGVGLLIIYAGKFRPSITLPQISWQDGFLLFILAVVLTLDFVEAVAPPADADSLAYHFALPKDFLSAARIEFVPRAVTGAIPLIVHMTYVAALGTGGELALTWWAMLTGWVPALLLYVLVRQKISRRWALAAALMLLTTPAVLYGGGNGQIEVRSSAFVLASVAFLLTAYRTDSYRVLLVAGLCAGFFVGAKFFGLIFVGAVGLVLMFDRKGPQKALIFGIAALFAGFQWYLWNWIHTGDPVFPVLTNMLSLPDSEIWTQDFALYFSNLMQAGELPLDRTILNWLSYPILSIFNLTERLEGGRTGLGICIIILLPLVIAGLLTKAGRGRDFAIPLLITLIFFTVWFFSGTTQRTRHLVPIYPLVLLSAFPLAVIMAKRMSITMPLVAAVVVALCIQIAGQMIFSANYLVYAFRGETRVEFLERNVPGGNSADWINRELPRNVKVGFMNRQLAYLIERPTYMLHPHEQVEVDVRPTTTGVRLFLAQVRKQKITHFLFPGDWQSAATANVRNVPFFGMIGKLIDVGCLKQIHSIKTVQMPSRTLSHFGGTVHVGADGVFALVSSKCADL